MLSAQTDQIDNGIYVVAAGSWTRAVDVGAGEVLEPYISVYVREGTDGGGHKLALQATADVTVGTDAQTWVHEYTFDNDAAHIDVVDTSFTEIAGTDVQTVFDSVDDVLAALETQVESVVGVTGNDLGTFTGTTITDNTDVKTALQELETGLEGIDVSGQIQTFYDGQKFQQTGVTLAAGAWTTITHSLNEDYPSGIEIYDVGKNRFTNSFNIEIIDANSLRIENEYPVALTDMIVVVRA